MDAGTRCCYDDLESSSSSSTRGSTANSPSPLLSVTISSFVSVIVPHFYSHSLSFTHSHSLIFSFNLPVSARFVLCV